MEKYTSQGKPIEVTVNSKEENSQDFCLDFVQEFGLCNKVSRQRESKKALAFTFYMKKIQLRMCARAQLAGMEVEQRPVHLVREGGEQNLPSYR